MNRLLVPALSLSLLLCAQGPLLAATKKHAAKPSSKAVQKNKKKASAKGEAAAPADEPLTEGQLAAASHVLTGRTDCEFKQSVNVEPVSGKPGHFEVQLGKRTYRMVPEETSTGAIRLHDKQADVVWLQIPVKSMMMDNKAGHRLVDACQHPQQRAAVEAVEQARVAAAAAVTAATAADTAAAAATTAAANPAAAMAASAAEKAATAASAAAQAASAVMPGNASLGVTPTPTPTPTR